MKGKQKRPKPTPFPLEFRRKAVKLHLEEGFSLEAIAREMGADKSTIHHWVDQYRQYGEAGIEVRVGRPRGSKVPKAVRSKIVEVKTQHPAFGIKRIAQWLGRVLCLKTSPETVRKTLHEYGLMSKRRAKTPRNVPKPRFFERNAPNQMWQSDIFMFRMGGQNAYLIGFIDDHSRYIVGLGLFRSQTGEHVLEVYRTAVAEYGVPKEMLTDNGRQYASWHGKTRFQQELAKDRIHHLRSAPHHPMTLGKIERFWKTIWEEFLVRAQFGSLEEAQARVRLWVKYYNHKRPHQGLAGLCPADRFFAVQHELRKAIEQGMQENVQELALRGEPKNPFYMVGRLGEQSVVMKVEKGQFKMLVDGEPNEPMRELTYDLAGGRTNESAKDDADAARLQRPGEVQGGVGGVDGTAAGRADQPGTQTATGPTGHLAATGDRGDAASVGAAAESGGTDGADAGRQGREVVDSRSDEEAGQTTAGSDESGAAARDAVMEEQRPESTVPEERRPSDASPASGPGSGSAQPATDAGDPAGGRGPDHGDGSCPATGRVEEDVLRMGEPGDGEPGRGPEGSTDGPAATDRGSGEGGAPAPGAGPGNPPQNAGAEPAPS